MNNYRFLLGKNNNNLSSCIYYVRKTIYINHKTCRLINSENSRLRIQYKKQGEFMYGALDLWDSLIISSRIYIKKAATKKIVAALYNNKCINQTLKRKCIISPSCTTYSFPSTPSFPASLIAASEPYWR